MTEFKQIIGRGTRINEEYGKQFFTIMDFRNVTDKFADPAFDGDPVRVKEINEGEELTDEDVFPEEEVLIDDVTGEEIDFTDAEEKPGDTPTIKAENGKLNLLQENQSQSTYLTKLRQAILQEAIEGKLTADWRKANPVRKGDPDYDAVALLKKIKAEKEKLIKEGKIKKQKPLAPIKPDEVPFELPAGWVWTRLGAIAESLSTGPFGSMLHKSDYVTNGIPVVNPMNMDNSGVFWVKSAGNKQKVTSREEIQRMFQSSGLMHGDEIPVEGLTIEHIDKPLFEAFFKKEFEEDLSTQENSLRTIFENMNLAKNGTLNVSGALLFGKNTSYHLPLYIVKAVVYPGIDIDVAQYIDSRDISGNLAAVFQHTISFLMIHIRHEQAGQSVNSLGVPEVPKIVFEELVANALIHRDYFISAPIRIFVFSNRIEIISPGHLPNNLTIENIKSGNSNIRNSILASFATKLLPYRGLGNGIRRAIKAYPDIDFIDDRENNMFKVIIIK